VGVTRALSVFLSDLALGFRDRPQVGARSITDTLIYVASDGEVDAAVQEAVRGPCNLLLRFMLGVWR